MTAPKIIKKKIAQTRVNRVITSRAKNADPANKTMICELRDSLAIIKNEAIRNVAIKKARARPVVILMALAANIIANTLASPSPFLWLKTPFHVPSQGGIPRAPGTVAIAN